MTLKSIMKCWGCDMNRREKIFTCISIIFVLCAFFVYFFYHSDQNKEPEKEVEADTEEIETADFGFGDTETETEAESDDQASFEETCTITETKSETIKQIETCIEGLTPERFKLLGVYYYNGYRFTWYSEKVLAGARLKIPDRWSDGTFVRDGEGNICCASSDLKWGTYVETPFGMGRIYDSGCASGTIDIYVSWEWHNKR